MPTRQNKEQLIFKIRFDPVWKVKLCNFSFSCMENLLTLLSSQNVSLQLYIVQVILILSWCRLSGKKSLKKVGLNGVGGVMVSLILYHELVICSLFLLVLIVWGFFPLVFGLKFTIVQTTLIEIWRKSFVAGVCCGVLGCGFVYLWVFKWICMELHGSIKT